MSASVPGSASPPSPPIGLIVVPIVGMTCRACERRIERHVRRIPNVQTATASASRARVEVVTSGPVSGVDVAEAIEAAGYEVGTTPWVTRDSGPWLAAGGGLALIVAVAVVADVTGLAGFASGAGDIREGGLVVAGLLGLAAGVSTCMALVGGLVLALSAAAAAGRPADADPSLAVRLRPTLLFLVGRVAGFAALGAGLGALGSQVVLPPAAIAVLMIVVAVVMTVLGIRLTGLSPRLAGWSPTLPGGLGGRLGLDAGSVASYSDTRAAALGAASFFLPCGFTQAVQVYALSTGSPLVAGGIMAVFALGTVPGLLALGGLPTLLPKRSRPGLLRAIGVVVIGFAVVNGTAGLRLAGFTPTLFAAQAPAVPVVTIENGVQTLRTFQLGYGYEPARAALYSGMRTRWIIESLEPRSCAVFLQVPSLNFAVTLRRGENVIELPPLRAGRIPYMCSMGMYGGELTVVDPAPVEVGAPASG
ncbi:MAG TPA: sulfite exporter TauE/SafE family protein [Candidatus Sulfomarinibacteraceae bacterium]|nr:sulfite exporter TauE/SafE family protein [Candidatus Sulfomarinibacteraceae bacterium]